MAAFQKINHLRVERLAIAGGYIAPVECPPDLPDEADLADVANAYEALIAHLTAAGIFTVPTTEAPAPEEAPAEEATDEAPAATGGTKPLEDGETPA